MANPKTQPGRAAGIFAFLVIAACVVFYVIGTHTKDSPEVQTRGAYSACQQFVEQRLKSPGSAKFPDALSADVTTVTSGMTKGVEVVTFISHVDSENGFGALLRSEFTCNLHTVDGGDTWLADDVSLNGS